jgi:Ca2+-binding EF-hand superfamily protein
VKILGKQDRDDDDMLTSAELQGRRPVSDDGQVLAITRLWDAGGQGGSRHFHVLGEGRTDRALAKLLIQRYAKDGKKRLDAKALGLTKLDRDQDGWLDEEELARLAEVTPDMELKVRLGKRQKGESLVEVIRKGKSLRKVETTDQNVVLTIDNARLELRGPESKETTALRIDFDARYKTQFKNADADNNDYLDRQEAQRNPLFRGLFAAMDRDGDGMLYEKEMLAYLAQVAKLRTLAARSCVTLVVKDDGKGLFERIDTDGDGRLSVRELRNMAKVLLRLDQDSDGKLALAEVPRGFRGSFEEGAASSRSGDVLVAFVGDGMDRTPPPRERTKGPMWFRKMDRNRDGDVSSKEWLGSDESFKEVDADGDGLISPEEAEAYDKQKRSKE